MKCQKCGATLVSERTTIEKPYRFVESGLSNIYLAGSRYIIVRLAVNMMWRFPSLGL